MRLLTSNIHYFKQVHSDKDIEVNNILNLKDKFADSFIAKRKGQIPWIHAADCLPALIADIKTKNIAACHSGLAKVKKRIISKTLKDYKK
tara:strand:- start:230 stop:499 length:270 start_codon:yes stop_codon:yes gene_type:complete